MEVKVIHYQLVADDCSFRKLVWFVAKTPAEPLNQLLPLITVYLCVAYNSLADKSRSFVKQSVFCISIKATLPPIVFPESEFFYNTFFLIEYLIESILCLHLFITFKDYFF